MQTELTTTASAELTTAANTIAALDQTVRANLQNTRAVNTRKAQASDLRAFAAFAAELGLDPEAPTTLARYLAHLDTKGAASATILRHAATIRTCIPNTAHPAITAQLDGIRRGRVATGGNRQNQAAAITPSDLAAILRALPPTLAGLRNRALLLLGFAGAFREAELVALTTADITPDPRGVLVTVQHSKTDQGGEGRVVAVPFGAEGACPVAALRAWLTAAAITSGPILRSVNRHGQVGSALTSHAVDGIIQAAAKAAGLTTRFTGHSLRAGLVTAAFNAGVQEADIMRLTGHKSVVTLRRYRRTVDAWQGNAAAPVLAAIR
jgi:integrase